MFVKVALLKPLGYVIGGFTPYANKFLNRKQCD